MYSISMSYQQFHLAADCIHSCGPWTGVVQSHSLELQVGVGNFSPWNCGMGHTENNVVTDSIDAELLACLGTWSWA